MGNIVNLRRARKSKAREEAGKAADANRLKFGRSKAEKQHGAQEKTRVDKSLAQHELDPRRPKR